jgi:hypothetical protein
MTHEIKRLRLHHHINKVASYQIIAEDIAEDYKLQGHWFEKIECKLSYLGHMNKLDVEKKDTFISGQPIHLGCKR